MTSLIASIGGTYEVYPHGEVPNKVLETKERIVKDISGDYLDKHGRGEEGHGEKEKSPLKCRQAGVKFFYPLYQKAHCA